MKQELALEYQKIKENLKSDCMNCSGLCCVALFCSKMDGFPADKEGGKPCQNLQKDFRCRIHNNLLEKKMRGCLAYDCFGAGQKVTRLIYPHQDWMLDPAIAREEFEVFMRIFQLHQIQWYLLEALTVCEDRLLALELETLIQETEAMTLSGPEQILKRDLEEHRSRVNVKLKQLLSAITNNQDPDKNSVLDYFGKKLKNCNLNQKNLSGALMIASDLEGSSLAGTVFLGADLRDANICNTDLSKALFLTQMQLNAARGNQNTLIPEDLTQPSHWKCVQ